MSQFPFSFLFFPFLFSWILTVARGQKEAFCCQWLSLFCLVSIRMVCCRLTLGIGWILHELGVYALFLRV